MSIFTKFKNLHKKFRYTLIVLLILIIGGGIVGGVAKHRFEREDRTQSSPMVINEVNRDLLYLENMDSTKLTQEQAKTIASYIEKVPGSKEAAQVDLAKKIYGVLTPEQYQTLLDRNDATVQGDESGFSRNGREDKKGENGKEKGFKGHDRFNNDSGNIREQAIGDVVTNMLKDIETGKLLPPKAQ